VELGQTYTKEQCQAMLGKRVLEFGAAVDRCVHVPVGQQEGCGLTSFAYNVGADAFCRSTLVVKLNAGDSRTRAISCCGGRRPRASSCPAL
jgi:lysozyme